MGGTEIDNGLQSDSCSAFDWEAEDPGTDRGEGNRGKPFLVRQLQGAGIGGAELALFVTRTPHRSDSVNNAASGETARSR